MTSQPFSVPILNNSGHNGVLTVNLALSNSGGGAILGTPDTAVLSIVDSTLAGSIQFAASQYSVSEVGPTATITVTRTGGTAGGATIEYATSEGTALAGTNYLPATGTLTFNSGEVSQTFTVPILDNGVPFGAVSLSLTLSNPGGGATLGSQAQATLWIVDTQ